MINFVLIAVCIITGVLFQHSKAIPIDAHKGINAWIIYIALPAASFKYLPSITWSKDLLAAVGGPILVWIGGWCYVKIYKRFRAIDSHTEGGLRLISGLSNTSFVGFPLVTAYFGEQYLSIAIICDQVTFLLLSTAGIVVAINSSKNQKLSLAVVIKRVIKFPPLLGCAGALIIPHFINVEPLEPLFEKLAGTVAPLALFSIGLQLKFNGWRSELKIIGTTLIYKLIMAPAAVMLLFVLINVGGIVPKITIFEAAMPTLLTAGVVADEYGLNSKISNLVIGIGIMFSLVTTGLWYLILK